MRRLPEILLWLALAFAWPLTVSAQEVTAEQLAQRLAALQSDPDLAERIPHEILQAQQAVDVLAKARSRQRAAAAAVADIRVEIAETALRTHAARRELEELDRTRNQLLLDISRRDAERARQEAERLRVLAQIQAEESERLRLAAESEQLAREDAEQALGRAAGQQAARVSAARQNEARLARAEAELVSGVRMPASKFEGRGEVFVLPADSFGAGAAQLSSSGKTSMTALAAYLEAMPKAKVRIEGYGDGQAAGQRRAEAIRDALVAGGVDASRVQVAGKAKGSKARMAELILAH